MIGRHNGWPQVGCGLGSPVIEALGESILIPENEKLKCMQLIDCLF